MSYAIFPGSFASTSDLERNKIILFDVDNTLIRSQSGERWPQSAEDSVFLTDSVPITLDKFHKEGWIVALVTNQATWEDVETQQKIHWVLKSLNTCNGWTPWCLIATSPKEDTIYRKPGRGLFDVLLSHLGKFGSDVNVVMVGDAVGPEDPFPPYRWASSDRLFAEAIGATFYRPIDLFRKI